MDLMSGQSIRIEKYYSKRLGELWKKAYKMNDQEMMGLIEHVEMEYIWNKNE